MRRTSGVIAIGLCVVAGCSSGGAHVDAASTNDTASATDAASGTDTNVTTDANITIDAASGIDAGAGASARDRLLATYLAFLRTTPSVAQSNGLRGADLTSVCDLWSRLDASSQATYLTLTARLAGSHLGMDGSPMLDHVVRLYRVTGGQGATATSPGSCGGGEYNRMIVSVDAELHAALVATNTHRGAATAGVFDIADVNAGTSWRDSHDAAGPHTPFDLSDETNAGAPRGQVQFFRDTTSAVAMAPLGRVDLTTLVEPLAMEIDQDYDCIHNSNPTCSYVTYGPACLPQPNKPGVDIYGEHYGVVDLTWRPTGC